VIAITVADGGVAVEATLEVSEQGRLGYRYRLLGDGVALHGVVNNRHAAFEAAFTRLLDHLRGRGVDLLPVVTVAVDGRRLRLRLRGQEVGGYACAVYDLAENGLPLGALGAAGPALSPRLALILGFELALAEAGVIDGERT
jgi:hypothetical protein